MCPLRLSVGLLSIWFLLLVSPLAFSQDKTTPIVIGETLTIHSTILQEDRSILIYKPDGYTESTARYPVLYLLDGDDHLVHVGSIANFMASLGLMPKMLIVGTANTDRGRDMTPIPKNGMDQDFPSGGGSESFLSFINQEVKPFIEAHYRTAKYEVLAGTSLSGLFSINTFLTQGDSFNAYFAISPALWWDKQAVPQLAEAVLNKPIRRNTFLYFTLCPEDSKVLQESTNRFKSLLERRKPDALSWQFKFIPDESHNSVVHVGMYWALKALYKNWQLPQLTTLAALENHYSLLSAQYGYLIELPEEQVNSLGYQLLFGGKATESIQVFKRNVEQFPRSSNAYDSLGDAYKVAGQLQLAKSSYERACALGKESNSPNLASYLNNLEQVSKLLNQPSQIK